MGTNYYLRENICPHCGKCEKELHIGKSSGGWCFSLHVIPDEGINSLEDWGKRWPGGSIFDEYGREIPVAEMIETINARGRAEPSKWTQDEYRKNHAEPGPKNLVRHAIGRYCVGHGAGTWDLIPGDFS